MKEYQHPKGKVKVFGQANTQNAMNACIKFFERTERKTK